MRRAPAGHDFDQLIQQARAAGSVQMHPRHHRGRQAQVQLASGGRHRTGGAARFFTQHSGDSRLNLDVVVAARPAGAGRAASPAGPRRPHSAANRCWPACRSPAQPRPRCPAPCAADAGQSNALFTIATVSAWAAIAFAPRTAAITRFWLVCRAGIVLPPTARNRLRSPSWPCRGRRTMLDAMVLASSRSAIPRCRRSSGRQAAHRVISGCQSLSSIHLAHLHLVSLVICMPSVR